MIELALFSKNTAYPPLPPTPILQRKLVEMFKFVILLTLAAALQLIYDQHIIQVMNSFRAPEKKIEEDFLYF